MPKRWTALEYQASDLKEMRRFGLPTLALTCFLAFRRRAGAPDFLVIEGSIDPLPATIALVTLPSNGEPCGRFSPTMQNYTKSRKTARHCYTFGCKHRPKPSLRREIPNPVMTSRCACMVAIVRVLRSYAASPQDFSSMSRRDRSGHLSTTSSARRPAGLSLFALLRFRLITAPGTWRLPANAGLMANRRLVGVGLACR